MKLLIIHQNFPGQFKHFVLDAVRNPNVQVVAIGRESAPGLPSVKIIRYKPAREASDNIHPYLRSFEKTILHGQQVLRIVKKLKNQGYTPDAILAHPGWGETLFIKDVYPDVPLIHYCEYYYQTHGADFGFDPEFPVGPDSTARVRANNASHLLNHEQCDVGITPTHWQHGLHPAAYHRKINVVHEGIDFPNLRPNRSASLRLKDGHTLTAGEPVVTYVARNLEPYRGFHSFMRAIPLILKENDHVKIVIVGGDGVSYGSSVVGYNSWREKMTAELGIDSRRVIFTGKLPTDRYRTLLQISTVHVYLTYPFVLSWSLLEAMASGCVIVASDTPPVREVIIDQHNGHLVNFFDSKGIAKKVDEVLKNSSSQDEIRTAARISAGRYNKIFGVTEYWKIIQRALASTVKE